MGEKEAKNRVFDTSRPNGPLQLLFVVLDVGIIYFSAVFWTPWCVYHFLHWRFVLLGISTTIPNGDWYLQHLISTSIILAFLFGLLTYTRRDNWAIWAWLWPLAALVFKFLLYNGSHSLLFESAGRWRYFFEIQSVMPTRANLSYTDPLRVWAQMTVTAPFFAGLAYSLGALCVRVKPHAFRYNLRRDHPNNHPVN